MVTWFIWIFELKTIGDVWSSDCWCTLSFIQQGENVMRNVVIIYWQGSPWTRWLTTRHLTGGQMYLESDDDQEDEWRCDVKSCLATTLNDLVNNKTPTIINQEFLQKSNWDENILVSPYLTLHTTHYTLHNHLISLRAVLTIKTTLRRLNDFVKHKINKLFFHPFHIFTRQKGQFTNSVVRFFLNFLCTLNLTVKLSF